MKTFILSHRAVTFLLCMAGLMSAFSAQANDDGGSSLILATPQGLSATSADLLQGATSQLVITLQPAGLAVAGWQLTLTPPADAGFTLGTPTVCLDSPATEIFDKLASNLHDDGSLTILSYSSKNKVYGEATAIVSIPVTCPVSTPLGEYTFSLSDVVLSDATGTATRFADTEFTARVGTSVINYQLELTPFRLLPGTTASVNLSLDNPANITTISCHIDLPEDVTLSDTPYTFLDNGRLSADNCSVTLADGTLTIQSLSENTPLVGTSGALLALNFTGAETMTNTSMSVNISDVHISSMEGESVTVDPVSTSVFSSSSTLAPTNGVLTYSGDFSSETAFHLLQESLPNADNALSVSEVDLSGVTALPEEAHLSFVNPNTLVYLSSESLLPALSSTNNTIINGVCDHFVLNDSYPFASTHTFQINKAEYARPEAQVWGTLCLPFEISSSDDLQLYTFTKFSAAEQLFYFTEAAQVEAGTPCLYNMEKAGTITVSTQNTTLSTSLHNEDAINVTMQGVYQAEAFDVTDSDNAAYGKNLYYFSASDGCLYHATGTLTVSPFRCYFEASEGVSAAHYRFSTDSTAAIETLTKSETSAAVLYDMEGRSINTPEKGVIYLLQGMKVIFE